jgi:hypothetical protein
VQRSKAAHPREQDADVQAPPHHLHERIAHLLESLWAAMVKGGCALGERRFTTARRVTDHPSSMEAGAEVFKDFTQLRGKRNLKQPVGDRSGPLRRQHLHAGPLPARHEAGQACRC